VTLTISYQFQLPPWDAICVASWRPHQQQSQTEARPWPWPWGCAHYAITVGSRTSSQGW